MGQTQDVPGFLELFDEEGATVAAWSELLRVSGEGWKFGELGRDEERSRAGRS